jgi:hypothetical protein
MIMCANKQDVEPQEKSRITVSLPKRLVDEFHDVLDDLEVSQTEVVGNLIMKWVDVNRKTCVSSNNLPTRQLLMDTFFE